MCLLTALSHPGFRPFSHLVEHPLTKTVPIQRLCQCVRLQLDLLTAKMYHQWVHMVIKDTSRLHQQLHVVIKDPKRLHQWMHMVILSRKGEGVDQGLDFRSCCLLDSKAGNRTWSKGGCTLILKRKLGLFDVGIVLPNGVMVGLYS